MWIQEQTVVSVAMRLRCAFQLPATMLLACVLSVLNRADEAWADEAHSELGAVSLSLAERIDSAILSVHTGPEVPLANDLEFQRRIYLDLIGRSPTRLETQSFLEQVARRADGSTHAREQLIDDLLARGEFSRYYSKVLEVMFTERREVIGMLELRSLIRQWLEVRIPLNELCLEMLSGDGTGGQMRATASFIINRNADAHLVTRDIGRIFFGRDVQCAQCHDHPLIADYEQSEYYGILSFVNRTYLFQDEKRGNALFLGEKGEGTLEFASVFRPEEKKSTALPILPTAMAIDAEPEFVDSSDAYVVAPDKDKRAVPRYSRRQQLAVLATHAENEAFNRNLANRLWANMMGMGVVHPVDMHHTANPPVSAALLRVLTNGLVECDYDLREFIRQIARSMSYQRSVHPPNLEHWHGPVGGEAALHGELARLQQLASQLEPQLTQLKAEMSEAARRVEKAQAEVNKLQLKIDAAKQEHQRVVEQRTAATNTLDKLKRQQAEQMQRVGSLQTALTELDKLLASAPADQQLVASRDLMQGRLTEANESKASIEQQLAEQQEVIEKANYLVDDQRGRVLALANRRLALGEFVVEARGVQRQVRKQIQAVLDRESDCAQQIERLTTLKEWCHRRELLESHVPSDVEEAGAMERLQVEKRQAENQLVESWRRAYSLRRVRALSPEQMAGAIYTALELDQPIRQKALSDWQASRSDPLPGDDLHAQQKFVDAAVADHMWGALEKMIMRRFSAAAGAPQDGFIATVDHALLIQNDPTVQAWLQPNEGSLVKRLISIENSRELAEQMYVAILCRLPDMEELRMVENLLSKYPAERLSIVQELAWGLLASAEFRFML